MLSFVDSGYGDADGVANGIIVDPSGPAFTESPRSSGDGSCFIGCLEREPLSIGTLLFVMSAIACSLTFFRFG